MHPTKSLLTLLILLVVFPGTLRAEESTPTKTIFPHVIIDRETKEIRIEASFSGELGTSKAILEFLLISSAEKSYEAAFSTKANPSDINFGLLLLGLKPGLPNFVHKKGETEEERAARTPPPPIDMLVEWEENGKPRKARIERLLTFRATDSTLDPMPWAFTGSYMYTTDEGKKILAAAHSNVIAALLFNPAAIINCPFYEPSPYNAPDQGFAINVPELPAYFRKKVAYEQNGKMVTANAARDCPVTFILRPSTMKLPKRPIPLPDTDEKEEASTKHDNHDHATTPSTPVQADPTPTEASSAPVATTKNNTGKDMLLVYALIGLGVLALANYVRISMKSKHQA